MQVDAGDCEFGYDSFHKDLQDFVKQKEREDYQKELEAFHEELEDFLKEYDEEKEKKKKKKKSHHKHSTHKNAGTQKDEGETTKERWKR